MMGTQQVNRRKFDAPRSEAVDLNERSWLPRHCRGDQHAFIELLDTYRNLVYTFLYRYGIEPQNREDVFQDIFLKVHQAAGSYRPSEPLQPWLISIALNTVRNYRRTLGRRAHFINRYKAQTVGLAAERACMNAGASRDGQAPEEQADQRSTIAWIEKQIANLPGRQREVIALSTLKGLRLKDIARVMALPENTVKTHLRRARLTLAKGLADRECAGTET